MVNVAVFGISQKVVAGIHGMEINCKITCKLKR